MINIYGSAQHDLSSDFLNEVRDFCTSVDLLFVMGGDFNLIRSDKDRNRGQGDPKLMELFNNFIGDLQLREIHVNGVKFTWSNKQQDPLLIKLDRILALTCWDSHFGSSFAWAKARVGSDHSPLILDTGEQRICRSKYFFFQEKWLEASDFVDMVRGKWDTFKSSMPPSGYSLHVWHKCL